MKRNLKTTDFEWDKFNLDKIYLKHNVSPKEAEEVFVSDDLVVLPDVKHSQTEERHIALGKTRSEKQLFVVFTMREQKIRVISARKMHGREVRRYAKIKNNS